MKKRKAASAYYELIIKTLVFITLIATAISFFGLFTTYLNLNYAARRVVREIEISGQVSAATYSLYEDMKANTNIPDSATMSVNAAYYNAAQKKIQLRDTFAVTCSANYRINVFTPQGGTPVGFDIPLKVRLTGMSEKFWK
ncbi:DUF4320 family protein [Ructibacterium gallinarum]|uniref:DUF4320 family protein n=1 Tax=Ructibacterium gallinarum TaxID=2779355 RepID=A0A9D5M745_9FIRM|nr:DUF4320 family protein [Ructibacterium gallinarum]MBE5040742.1 DUF4320 family protein [Ructibacterium gallinarum]